MINCAEKSVNEFTWKIHLISHSKNTSQPSRSPPEFYFQYSSNEKSWFMHANNHWHLNFQSKFMIQSMHMILVEITENPISGEKIP